jgi:hypothetical protein
MHFDLGELERELNKYVNWCRKNVVKRTQEGHLRGIRNWFKKAKEFKADGQAAGAGLAGVPGPAGDSGLGSGDGLAFKLAAYRKFLAQNPRQAQEYLDRQPERVQQAIREAGE